MQSGCDKDEGLCLDIDCTDDFTSSLRINEEDRSTSGSDSSTLGSDNGDSPTRGPFRGRAYLYSGNRRSSKQKELASELGESRGRSASLPTDCRKVGKRLRSIGSSNSSIDSSTSGSSKSSNSLIDKRGVGLPKSFLMRNAIIGIIRKPNESQT